MAYRIMEEMHSSPFSTLVVGDSVLDMKMARTAGCYTCAVAYGTCSAEKLRKQSPDRIIHRFEELAEIPDINYKLQYIEYKEIPNHNI